MDFFAPDASHSAVSAQPDATDPFAEAIGRRFGASAPMLTARLLLDESPLDTALNTPQAAANTPAAPPLLRPGGSHPPPFAGLTLHSPARRASPVTAQPAAADTSRYTAVDPKDLPAFLASTPAPLTLDVRSGGAHTLSHIRGAISLSVPSTLLKRPKFSLTNLSTMIASSAARSKFDSWSTAQRVLVYDADLSRLTDGSGVLGLMRKFEAAGFKGELAWLVGGHNALARSAPECLEAAAAEHDETPPPPNDGGRFLHTHNLPQSAFQQSSTVGAGHHSNKVQAFNPFYDNIRQNQELSHGITERIPLSLPQQVLCRKDEIPIAWLREIVESSDKEKGIEALAMQFYRVELGEQRRLQGVMSHHSREAQIPTQDEGKDPHGSRFDNKRVAEFPYSITAGVEKGAKNRYKNIWPYEHARVRLHTTCDDECDYVNASFVQPRGTRLKYIATQGPLPATYVDFWTMVWEQNVHVIVMLTRQVENNQLKCGDYWSASEYGPLRLRLVATEGGEEHVERITGFDFGQSSKKPELDDACTIRRTFALSHADHPHAPPRKIVQFQFLSWADMNVPETPAGLLELVKNVREAADETTEGEASIASDPTKNPVLVHCSAGVGRTGSFIAIDAILDGVRQYFEAQRAGDAITNTSSDNTSDSDLENGNPSSDSASVPSPRFRRTSQPEGEARRPVGLHMTLSKQRPRSLRRTLGARRTGPRPGSKNGSPPSDQESATGVGLQLGTMTMDGAQGGITADGPESGAGGTSRRLFNPDVANQDSSTSTSSASSFNFPTPARSSSFSTPEPSVGGGKEPGLHMRLRPPQLREWSSNVAENVSRSDLVPPQPVPTPSPALAVPSPRPDSVMDARDRDTFDYVQPRSLERSERESVSPLSSMSEPIREVLEDMREQRMSLCQSLRQYVFVHRAVVEGVLAMVDEQRAKESDGVVVGAKRHASPTELVKVDMAGSKARVKKRPSYLGDDARGDPMVVDA